MKKKVLCFLLPTLLFALHLMAADVKFSVQGLQTGDYATVSIGSDFYLSTQQITANGDFTFANINEGSYFIKIEAEGYNLPATQKVNVNADGTVEPVVGIRFAITKMDADSTVWTHSWKEDDSSSGYVTTSHINTQPTIEFLGKTVIPSIVPNAWLFYRSYKIILSDEEEPWTDEYAYRLHQTLKTLSYDVGNKYSKFILTSRSIDDDIQITQHDDGNEVLISKDAFYYANPFIVNLDSVRGRFFSKRLHHAMVCFATNYGKNVYEVNKILKDNFGCTTKVPDYTKLTETTTQEDAACFQAFKPAELVSIINMFEEMPVGFHVTPHLNYLVRRQDGHINPKDPDAAAISYCIDNGYIEFMSKAFEGDDQPSRTLRLILHEKTHFLWAYNFSEEIKNDWTALGGWYKDPNSGNGWSTTKSTEFVSEYAHRKNPDEDMAESVAFYIKDPTKLLSRAPEKYAFIRDRIMHGTRYISQIPGHLTFEVLNLHPDYDYPGKIKRLDIKVQGAPDKDKKVIVEIELNHIEGFSDGSSEAITRIYSPEVIVNGKKFFQYYDIHLTPVKGNDHLLRGSVTINRYSLSGYWTTNDIRINDAQGNSSFEGRNDYVWNLYINNPLQDMEPPRYVPGSLSYDLTDCMDNGHKAHLLQVTFKATDNVGISKVMARLEYDGIGGDFSSKDQYGTYDNATQTATINFLLRDYQWSGNYYIAFLDIIDKAQYSVCYEFSKSSLQQPVKYIYIATDHPDTIPPQLDLNRITVYAQPINREEPDGETLVTINYFARDNSSGLKLVYFCLQDPQGLEHADYEYDDAFNFNYCPYDPTVWRKFTIKKLLPQGSVPGIWGLKYLIMRDAAWNERTYNFVETLIFEPDNAATSFTLSAAMNEDRRHLSISVSSDSLATYSVAYRIVNDATGQEISGTLPATSFLTPAADVDVSSLSDGELIILATITDEQGNTVAVKSSTLTKTSSTDIAALTDEPQISVTVANRSMTVSSPRIATLSLFSLNGSEVKRVHIPASSITFPLQNGVYIVNGKKYIVR